MAKKICVVCNKELGLLSMKTAISDGVVCADCLRRAGISVLPNSKAFNTVSINNLISKRTLLVESFSPTKKVGTYIAIDENNKSFKIGRDIFEYDNLLSYELLEDGETVTKGSLGRAVAGGLLFGGVGAIVGGITGGKKSKGLCNSMKMRVTLQNAHTDTVYISFISTETKKSSFVYKTAQSSAQSCISALENIAACESSKAMSTASQSVASEADEILKFKQLLDSGVISQEEFEAKKKQILGI